VVLDQARALCRAREPAVPSEARAVAAEILEGQRLDELHRLDVVAAGVAIGQALGLLDFIEDDAVLVIAAVRPMHDEAPGAAGPEVESMRGGGEAVRAPPLRQVLGIGEGREYQVARRVELARADDRARVTVKIDAISCGHAWPPLACSCRSRS